ncbi:hypothetical protein [Phaeobacter sp.]|uniref:hypothetical protein n=1 Tax=Phaeobacter sp. TaxID=1902409 RepID=UPI0025D201D2|nr:hypothetical protein [Phaeobacter sp.]
MLRARGWQVIGFDRCAGPNVAVTGDRFNPDDLAKVRHACPEGAIVFDLIAYEETAVQSLCNALDGKLARYVVLSTVSVYSSLGSECATEAQAVLGASDGPGYQAGKRRAEQSLTALALDVEPQ